MRVFTMAHARRLARRDFKALSGEALSGLIQKARANALSGEVFSGHLVPSNPDRIGTLLKAYTKKIVLLSKYGE